jgi:hypothetical protein
MPDRDAGLRALYAAAQRGAGAAHPTEDALLGLLGESDAALDGDVLLDHVARCAECAAFLQHVGRCQECATVLGLPRAGVPEDGGPRRRWAIWGGLAAAGLVVGLWVGPFQSRVLAPTPPPDVVRGEAGEVPQPLAPSGRLASPPSELLWRAVRGARSYQLRILDAQGEILWSSAEVRRPALAWPSELRLGPGAYSWQVVALLTDGDRIASPTESFEIP